MTYAPTIFPTLAGRRWAMVNLDALAHTEVPPEGDNPLLDPAICDAWVRGVADGLGVDFTYGGYMEDRSTLWRGHYHDPEVMTHLGVDFNVAAGTPVAVPAACTVVGVLRDPDQSGGWGGRVLIRFTHTPRGTGVPYLLFAHLAHDGLPEVGTTLTLGQTLGVVGPAEQNGGWYPHLHVQGLTQAAVERFGTELVGLDGYGPARDRHWDSDCPDPTQVVGNADLPGIERFDWWETQPRISEEADAQDYRRAERRWVLDKATRHRVGDNARGWSIKHPDGSSRSCTEAEFVLALRAINQEFVRVWFFDGFWSLKLNG